MASEALNGSHMNELYKPKQDALMVMSLGSSGKPMVISSTVPVIFSVRDIFALLLIHRIQFS